MTVERRCGKDEGIYEEVKIPKVIYEDSDDKLLERVSKLKKGTLRIVIFMVVGMIVGWFSYSYTADSFIVTKIILAIPYKLSEAIYVSIIGTDTMTEYAVMFGFNEFFQQSTIATFLAERITPVLIGGAIYGSLAYFTGDKRVFTLQRFVKFAGVQMAAIALFVAAVYGINAKAVSDNDKLHGVEYFYLESPFHGEMIYDERAEVLLHEFEAGLKKDEAVERNADEEVQIGILFKDSMRSMTAFVNTRRAYLVTQNGTGYRVSEEFAGYVEEYYETGGLMGIQTIYSE